MNLQREFLLLNLERPVEGPTYADDYIERWAGVYLANPALRLLGVPFSVFLTRPAAWLDWIGKPLRGSELEVVTRIAVDKVIEQLCREGARCENGRFVEKLRHHAHPRSGGRDFVPDKAAS